MLLTASMFGSILELRQLLMRHSNWPSSNTSRWRTCILSRGMLRWLGFTALDTPGYACSTLLSQAVSVDKSIQELYEPLWEDLVAQAKKNSVRIRAVWMADAANQGASGILNEQYLGNDRE